MSSVFVVTSGSYSSYSIEAVFSTREAAEAFVAQRDAVSSHRFVDGEWQTCGADVDIEEYPLDDPPTTDDGDTWHVRIYENGNVGTASLIRAKWLGEVWNAPGGPQVDWSGKTCFVGVGETPEHARRQAEDFRRAWLTQPRP